MSLQLSCRLYQRAAYQVNRKLPLKQRILPFTVRAGLHLEFSVLATGMLRLSYVATVKYRKYMLV